MVVLTMDKYERMEELSNLAVTLDGMSDITNEGRKLVGIVLTGVLSVRDSGGYKKIADLPPTELVHLISRHYSTPNLKESGELSDEAKNLYVTGRLLDMSHNRLYNFSGPLHEVVAFAVMMREELDANLAGQEGSRETS